MVGRCSCNPLMKARPGRDAIDLYTEGDQLFEAMLANIGRVVDVVNLPGPGYDLVVQLRDDIWKVEVKDDALPPSERRLTDSELRSQRESGGRYVVVQNIDDALALVRSARFA